MNRSDCKDLASATARQVPGAASRRIRDMGFMASLVAAQKSVAFAVARLALLGRSGKGLLTALKEVRRLVGKSGAVWCRPGSSWRLPLTMRYITGADYDTICMQLGLSNGSLRGLLHRGLKLLREKLPPALGEV